MLCLLYNNHIFSSLIRWIVSNTNGTDVRPAAVKEGKWNEGNEAPFINIA
jgi:hypothetical protein